MIAALHVRTRRFTDRIARFHKERRGVAALEFAILLPLMLALYLGGTELSTGVSVQRKVNLTASALADLASQFTTIQNADMTNILNAASDIIAPYAASNLAATVSELSIDANGNATVVWSDSVNGQARPVGQTVTIPPSLAVPNSYLILGEAVYTYNPTYAYAVTGTLSLNDQIFMGPRQSNSVTRIDS